MTNKCINLRDFIPRAIEGMKSYGMRECVMQTYISCYRNIYVYLTSNGHNCYDEEIGEEYCRMLLSSNRSINYKQRHIRAVNVINLILNDKPYTQNPGIKPKDYTCIGGELGNLANQFVEYERSQRLHPRTIRQIQHIMFEFNRYTIDNNITLSNLDEAVFINYINEDAKSRIVKICYLRKFAAFLYESGYVADDFSKEIVMVKRVVREKLISYYSETEIMQIEKSINRETKNGKRDYALIVLATRLGLRASDIVALKFDDIDWENNLITLTQYKTKRQLSLPLLSVVGEAIADYILHARPKTKGIDNIFISSIMPFRPCSSHAISSLAFKYITASGVSTHGRHTGAHSLRHSLATTLMNNGTNMSTITEVLGHKDGSTSTMLYLGVNILDLKTCSLEVPSVPNSFYVQKGGKFYERY